jgi:hypothetical protein
MSLKGVSRLHILMMRWRSTPNFVMGALEAAIQTFHATTVRRRDWMAGSKPGRSPAMTNWEEGRQKMVGRSRLDYCAVSNPHCFRSIAICSVIRMAFSA